MCVGDAPATCRELPRHHHHSPAPLRTADVAISVLLTFNRLKQLTTDAKVVAESLLESAEVQLSADLSKVRRARGLPQADESKLTMVYLKGFPSDATLEQLEAWGPNGDVARYVMRRDLKRRFKGSVFLEMKSRDAALAIVRQHNEKPLEFHGKPLIAVMMRDDYLRKKREQRTSSRTRRGTIREEDLMSGFKKSATPGVIVKVNKLPEETHGEAFDAAVREIADVKFVEMDSVERDACYIRCGSAGAASLLAASFGELATAEAVDANPKLSALSKSCAGAVPTARVLDDAEASPYWDRVWDVQSKRYRVRMLKKLGKTERDIIPAGSGASGAAAASSAAASSSSSASSSAVAPVAEAAAAAAASAAADDDEVDDSEDEAEVAAVLAAGLKEDEIDADDEDEDGQARRASKRKHDDDADAAAGGDDADDSAKRAKPADTA